MFTVNYPSSDCLLELLHNTRAAMVARYGYVPVLRMSSFQNSPISVIFNTFTGATHFIGRLVNYHSMSSNSTRTSGNLVIRNKRSRNEIKIVLEPQSAGTNDGPVMPKSANRQYFLSVQKRKKSEVQVQEGRGVKNLAICIFFHYSIYFQTFCLFIVILQNKLRNIFDRSPS